MVITLPVDLSLYIPVICTQDVPKYNGKCFMEAISKVQRLNREPILSNRHSVKADFKTGDLVVVKFMNQHFSSIVAFSLDEEAVSKSVNPPPGLVGSTPLSVGLEV